MVTNYLFSSWDTNADFTISSPTTFTAQYTSETYEDYVVTFNDLADNKLASAGASKNGTATYPTSYKEIVDMCYSYDAENVTMFVGWDKSLDNVTSSMTVTAQTKTISRKQNGEYPQADVNDWELCSKLDNLTTADAQGYYEYNGEKYYEFSERRYKKVEPIKWRYMSDKGNGVKEFIADGALDRRSWNESDEDYEDGSHANNYAKSDIREWLNNEFVTRAFYYDQSLVQTAVVDNSSETTDGSGGEYACEDTTDMAYLPSYSQIMNHENGFVSADTLTDEDGDVLGWWTRSPGLSPSSAIAKYRGTQNNGLGIKTGIRPCIRLKIS